MPMMPITPTPTSSVTPTNTPAGSIPITPSNTPTAPLPDPDIWVGSNEGIIRKISPSGVMNVAVQAHDNDYVITAITVDPDGNVYTGSSDNTV